MAVLKELHAEGHTIIIVTHDMQVASHAQRIIEISDGRTTADRSSAPAVAARPAPPPVPPVARPWLALRDRLGEAFAPTPGGVGVLRPKRGAGPPPPALRWLPLP
jgi:macrolide transport system ATP-binding/permease protein